MSQLLLALAVFAAFVLLFRFLLWHGLRLAGALAARYLRWRRSRLWRHGEMVGAWLARRFPRLHAQLRRRLNPRAFSGLPLTLIAVAALYLLALMGGLVEDVIEADEVVAFDAAIDRAVAPWRADPPIAIFLWITALGAGPALAAVALVSTGFLWAHRRPGLALPLWIAILGAQATTWLGKFAIGRPRPDFTTVATALSPSFPSSHTTGSLAVYGCVAYILARDLARPRRRFELAFWTAILVASIAFSRVYLGVHFASDVLAGLLVGIFWLLVGIATAEWIRERRSR